MLGTFDGCALDLIFGPYSWSHLGENRSHVVQRNSGAGYESSMETRWGLPEEEEWRQASDCYQQSAMVVVSDPAAAVSKLEPLA